MQNKKKILFSVGGTGGHLFPAQALARNIKRLNNDIEILFVGSGLSKNPYFEQSQFSFLDISSASPSVKRLLQSLLKIGKGTWQSLSILNKFAPELIVGFGSFHSFPMLMAARLKTTPYILFEPNLQPGKVNRHFAKNALFSAVTFPVPTLKGNIQYIEMPLWAVNPDQPTVDGKEAKKMYGLSSDKFTLLVFGGSQGASWINEQMSHLKVERSLQIIHLVGNEKDCDGLRVAYERAQIPAHVKAFEKQMHLAWSAADMALCRAGASTIAELLFYEKPALLIPYPYANEHQEKNGLFFQNEVRGGIIKKQREIDAKALAGELAAIQLNYDSLRKNITSFKMNETRQDFARLILDTLNSNNS